MQQSVAKTATFYFLNLFIISELNFFPIYLIYVTFFSYIPIFFHNNINVHKTPFPYVPPVCALNLRYTHARARDKHLSHH